MALGRTQRQWLLLLLLLLWGRGALSSGGHTGITGSPPFLSLPASRWAHWGEQRRNSDVGPSKKSGKERTEVSPSGSTSLHVCARS